MSLKEDPFSTPIPLDRDTFMRQLIASLGHLNEAILGSDVAGAYIMNVGLSMGAAIEAEYKRFWGIDRPFTLDEYAHVIVDLKQKIQGNFSLVSKDPTKIVVSTTSCPFDDFVRRSPSLCFMTSSVFGGIAARNFGYGKTVLHKRIALGDPGCYVTVYLQRTPEAAAAIGKEYYPDIDRASSDIAEQLRLMDSVRWLYSQLHETRARWEELVHGAAEAICILSLDGRISFANARWRNVLGVESGELIGETVDRLTHPEDRQQLVAAVAQASAGERVFGWSVRLRDRHEAWRDLLVSLSPIRDDVGAVTGVLGIFHDVTEERNTQRLKDHFLAAASHELRTPLTSIKTATELLLRNLNTKGTIEPDLLARRLEIIRQEADRLVLFSTELLDVAQLQKGKLPMQLTVQDLNDLVQRCVSRQQELLGSSSPHIITFQPFPNPLLVRVEAGRIEQVITNLLTNAVKYSPEGGEVVVSVQPDGSRVRLSVADRGIGIPQQDLPKIFTPFFRASNASSDRFMGLGLGLYISRAVVEAHGGELLIESSEGRGTTATMVLPLHSEDTPL
ncbi:MAG: hypothetical protein KatS3mg057_1467 [Herpetosiphonaceae bacterium]|nr:MAG: hypothetical protein KatS3mg057_1467 [Herpetosiphonaceae bacterium]